MPSNRRRLSERVEEDLAKSQGQHFPPQRTALAQNPSQVSLPNNNTSSIASTEPPSTPLKSITPIDNEIDDFTEKIAEDINAFKRRSRGNSRAGYYDNNKTEVKQYFKR